MEDLFINIKLQEDRYIHPTQEISEQGRKKIEDIFYSFAFAEAEEFELAKSYSKQGIKGPNSPLVRISPGGIFKTLYWQGIGKCQKEVRKKCLISLLHIKTLSKSGDG